MTKYILPIILLAIISCRPNKVQAQIIEVGYAPINVAGWGKLPKTTKFNLSIYLKVYEYQAFRYTPGIRYSHIRSESNLKDKYGITIGDNFNSLFVTPIAFEIDWGMLAFINRFGVGYTDKSFPNKNGLHLNFLLETGLSVSIAGPLNFSIRYSHVSNGFRGRINPGLDNILFITGFRF